MIGFASAGAGERQQGRDGERARAGYIRLMVQAVPEEVLKTKIRR